MKITKELKEQLRSDINFRETVVVLESNDVLRVFCNPFCDVKKEKEQEFLKKWELFQAEYMGPMQWCGLGNLEPPPDSLLYRIFIAIDEDLNIWTLEEDRQNGKLLFRNEKGELVK